MSMKPLTSLFKSTPKPRKTEGPGLHVERRGDPRLPVLTGELPGTLRFARTNRALECGAINVSVGGLCVWLTEPILVGGTMELVVAGRSDPIPLTVVYCRRSVEEDDGKRWICGLRVSQLRVENLVQIFIAAGCVD